MSDVHQLVDQQMKDGEVAYVLITCKGPLPDGTMDVSMTHQGDPMLLSYLLEGAQTRLDDQEESQTLYS